ncbi:MAG: hypothetical protein JXB35_16630 [Anaerolineae bacterium]|nr:hypothetical protein [Anaerolineae bacterium]
MTQRTDSQLILQGKSMGFILALMGVVFAVVGLAAFVFLGQTATLSCDRSWTPDPCRIDRTLLGVTLKTESLNSLLQAYINESRDSDGDLTYQVVLVTLEGDVPLTSYTSSGYSKHLRIVNEINAFLENREQRSLKVDESGGLGMIFGGVFAVVGIGLLLAGLNTIGLTWVFDSSEGLAIKERRGLGGTRQETYPLSDIVRVYVDESRDSDGDYTYRVELGMANGDVIPLTGFYSSGRSGKEDTAQAIREFLGL